MQIKASLDSQDSIGVYTKYKQRSIRLNNLWASNKSLRHDTLSELLNEPMLESNTNFKTSLHSSVQGSQN